MYCINPIVDQIHKEIKIKKKVLANEKQQSHDIFFFKVRTLVAGLSILKIAWHDIHQ